MLYTIVDIFIFLFEALLLWFYCYTAFKSRFKKPINFLIILVAYTALFWICQLRINYLNGIANTLFIFLIILIVYKQKFLSSLIHALIIYSLLIATEYIVIPLLAIVYGSDFEAYKTNELFYLYGAIISKILHFISCVIVLKIYLLITKDSSKGFALILIVPIANVVILTLIQTIVKDNPISNQTLWIWIVSAALMVLSSFMVFYNRSYLIRQAERINELTVEKQKRELDQQFFAVLEKANDDMQILAHDFKNHLAQINSFTEIKDVNHYVNKIYPEVEVFTSTGISNNKTLDLIISKYLSLCELKHIKFSFDIREANLSQMDSVDLSSLLNNLLDNAVEASENCSTKNIDFSIKRFTQFYDQIVIENSCGERPFQKNNILISKKSDNNIHGIGLKSVKKIVKKYDGVYAWEYDDNNNVFTTTITIPKEAKNAH